MKMCKNCNTYLAMPGSEYCASCNPSGLDIYQGQEGTGPQQQAQNISASGISVSQQQSQASGGTQQQAFTKGRESDGQVMKKLNAIHSDVKDVKRDVSSLIENQILQYETLYINLENLIGKREELNSRISNYESLGKFSEANEIQNQVELLRKEIRNRFSQLDSHLDDLTENLVQIMQKQDVTEQFLRDHLSTDWEKVKDIWKEYKLGNIEFKELIKRIIKIVGMRVGKNLLKKLLSTATGGLV